jgi:hypothetical protein
MNEEKRKSDTIMPADLKEMLNDRQLRALPGIKCLGREPQFFRKPMFNAPTLVLRNSKDGRLAILDEEGGLERQGDLKLREDESEAPPAPPRNLQYF